MTLTRKNSIPPLHAFGPIGLVRGECRTTIPSLLEAQWNLEHVLINWPSEMCFLLSHWSQMLREIFFFCAFFSGVVDNYPMVFVFVIFSCLTKLSTKLPWLDLEIPETKCPQYKHFLRKSTAKICCQSCVQLTDEVFTIITFRIWS